MFKKRERPQANRKLDKAEEEGESGAIPDFKKPKRGAASSSSGGDDGGIGISASTKKTAQSEVALNAAMAEGTRAISGFKASGTSTNTPSSDATRQLEVDTDVSMDNRSILERNAKINKGLKDGTLEAGVYRGLGAYKKYANQSEGAIAASKYTGLLGPLRNSMSGVRSTLRIEYIGTSGDGGICKDYKETGYCGFGDSCKFAHDRSDYKPSYILEREWEEKQKKIEEKRKQRWEARLARRKKAEAEGKALDSDDDSDVSSSIDSDDEDLPTECPECNETWEDCKSMAIVTICGHYFCEDCAMTAFASSPKCLNCGAATNGIFNSADELEKKLKEKKEMKKQRKKQKAAKKMGNRRQGENVANGFGISLESDM
eukprot:TRINITY_DN1939_c1_g2_i1.p1 TRINITY_DN1939_c1_g2~~TRINITY_DN1939_c1_g2_i1.p1  ORF type:complete len:373 (+),score=109.51 TRINITY_DN1939_c1_g2_i1:94-1212(+)